MLIIYANNGAKIVNLPLALVDMFFEIFKLGSPFCKYFLTIDDLCNGAQMVNLPLVVVEI